MKRGLPLSGVLLALFSLVWVVAAADRDYQIIATEGQPAPRPRQVLFFGYNDPEQNTFHLPRNLYNTLRDDFERFQINLTFTDDFAALDPAILAAYDAVILYGYRRVNDLPKVTALVEFVEAGGGLVGIHVASWTFPTSVLYEDLLGGRALGHGPVAEFSQIYPETDPPILAGLEPYVSEDEPYSHKNLRPDIKVLSWRDPVSAGEIATNYREPYTWIRTQGLGRVFYHAGGHDQRTWDQPGYRELLARGVRWTSEAAIGRNFGTLEIPQIFDDGTIVIEGDSAGAAGIWAGRSAADLAQVARHGEASPPQLGGGNWDLPAAEIPRVAGDGEVTLIAGIDDGGGGTTLSVIARKSGVLEALLADGAPLLSLGPGISVNLDPPMSSPHLVASSSGVAIVRVALAGTAGTQDDTAILRLGAGEVSVMAREGNQVPSLPPGVLFGDLRSVDLSIAEDGSWAGVVPLIGAGVTEADDSAVIFAAAAAPITAIREGGGLPGLGGVSLGAIGSARVAGIGRVILSATLVGAVTPADDAALLRWLPADTSFDVLLRDGDSIGSGRLIWAGGGSSWVCNQDGQVIVATRRAGAGITAANDEGIWFSDGISIVPLAIEGAQVPRKPDGTVFASGMESSPLCLSEGPTAAFIAQITGGEPARDALVAGSVGALGVVFAEGDLLEVGAGSRAITALDLASGASGSGLAGVGLVIRAEIAGSDAAIVAFRDLRDLDGDAVDDWLELAFGTDPEDASDGQSGLPRMVFDGGEPAVEFRRQSPPGSLDYLLEESADLLKWVPSTAIQTLAGDQSGLPAGIERVLATDGANGFRKFFRLRVSGG